MVGQLIMYTYALVQISILTTLNDVMWTEIRVAEAAHWIQIAATLTHPAIPIPPKLYLELEIAHLFVQYQWLPVEVTLL